ncbi:MAG: NAD(P)H-quinone oxidoreductase subunit 2, chloroplastic [Myxococcota bacterium]|nr:NAD(P)H-quinone oxidoreductase subunit 2, chloroplastic [Myxococcota bacterium]
MERLAIYLPCIIAAIGASVTLRLQPGERARIAGAAFSGAAGIVGALLFISAGIAPWEPFGASAASHLRDCGLDGLNSVLLVLCPALSAAVLMAIPRAMVRPRDVAETLINLSSTLGFLVAKNPLLLLLFWVGTAWPLRAQAARSGNRVFAATLNIVVFVSAIPLAIALAGAAYFTWQAGGDPFTVAAFSTPAGMSWVSAFLWIMALLPVFMRMGVFPFHGWIILSLESAPGPVVISTVASPAGAFALARLTLQLFPDLAAEMAFALITLSAVTAVYGAILALCQYDLRSMIGYMLISSMGFAASGLFSLDRSGMSGAFLHEIAMLLGFTGLLLMVFSVQARTGAADIRRLGGLVRGAPRMATGFLLLSLAVSGFPGGAAFVSEDLMMQGLIGQHPTAMLLLLMAGAMNGVTLFRGWKRTFLGCSAPGAWHGGRVSDLTPRERWTSIVLTTLLVTGGLVPGPALTIREGVVNVLRNIHSTQTVSHPSSASRTVTRGKENLHERSSR